MVVGLAILAFALLFVFKRWPSILAILPLPLILLWLAILAAGVDSILDTMVALSEALDPVQQYYSAVDKVVSGTNRLTFMAVYFANAKEYLFGAPFLPGIAIGLLLHMLLYAGLAGLLFVCMLSYRIFKHAINVFAARRGRVRLMAALVYGLWFQVILFSEYGWVSMPGFMMMGLIYQRLKLLDPEEPLAVRGRLRAGWLLSKAGVAPAPEVSV